MKLYTSKRADVTKTLEDGKEYYIVSQYINIDYVNKLLEHSRSYILGKEIAYSNTLALLRIIKQTTKYTAYIKIYTRKIGKQPEKIIIEVRAKKFPKITLYISPNAVEVVYDKELYKKSKILEAYVPRKTTKKYINHNNKNKNGGENERYNRNTRGGGLRKR